jgi:hypothetical protein
VTRSLSFYPHCCTHSCNAPAPFHAERGVAFPDPRIRHPLSTPAYTRTYRPSECLEIWRTHSRRRHEWPGYRFRSSRAFLSTGNTQNLEEETLHLFALSGIFDLGSVKGRNLD